MNTLKSLAHAVHQALQPLTPSKRSHAHELIAALFGFKTYAALSPAHLLYVGYARSRHRPDAVAAVHRRCRELGYPDPVVTAMGDAVVSVMTAQQIDCVRLSDLIRALESSGSEDGDEDEDEHSHFPEEYLASPELLISQLQDWAEAKRPEAHYVLARLYLALIDSGEEASEFSWRQGQNGVVLSPVQQGWADAFALREDYETRALSHLQQAARLGYGPARIRLAEQTGDASIFDEGIGQTSISPRRMVRLAHEVGRTSEAEAWQIRGAASGDLALMRELLQNETGSLKKRWVWVYFGQFMGEDLLAAAHAAVHEDGSAYDDDVGGAMYVTGDDAIELAPLSDLEDQAARAEAVRLYEVWAAAAEREGRVEAARLLPFWLARAAEETDRDGADDEPGGSA